MLNDVVFNQVALCCGAGAEGDRQTEAVLREVQARGRVYPSHGVWRGRQIIRISVSGYATQAEHADLAAHEIITAWRGLHAG